MLQIKLLINGRELEDFQIINDSTGTLDTGNYDVFRFDPILFEALNASEFRDDYSAILRASRRRLFRIENFDRNKGATELAKLVLERVCELRSIRLRDNETPGNPPVATQSPSDHVRTPLQ